MCNEKRGGKIVEKRKKNEGVSRAFRCIINSKSY